MRKDYSIYIALIVLLVFGESCRTQQILSSQLEGNVEDLFQIDTTFQHHIKADDKLSLSVWNHDDLSLGSVFSIYNSNEAYGKWILVDQAGYVQIPKLGKVKVLGMSTTEAADTISRMYAKHINNPIVVVKVLNRYVTILGEVRAPKAYPLEKEQMGLIEILGKAEGFTQYANLNEVRLVRNGLNYTLDLENGDAYRFDKLILQSEDILIVSAKKGKVLDQKAPTLIPFASALTAIAVVASFVLN